MAPEEPSMSKVLSRESAGREAVDLPGKVFSHEVPFAGERRRLL